MLPFISQEHVDGAYSLEGSCNERLIDSPVLADEFFRAVPLASSRFFFRWSGKM
jgi:hypothetical protein